MNTKYSTLFLLLIIFSMLHWGCEKDAATSIEEPTPVVNPPIIPPKAFAGSDQWMIVPANSVSLSASYSYTSGAPFKHKWRQVSGPNNATITQMEALKTDVIGLIKGEYAFEFAVTNSLNMSGKDTVTVYVNEKLTTINGEMVFMDAPWICPLDCYIIINCISCHVTLNKPFKIYVLEKATNTWHEAVRADLMSVFNYYGYSIEEDNLFIFTENPLGNTSDIKIVY